MDNQVETQRKNIRKYIWSLIVLSILGAIIGIVLSLIPAIDIGIYYFIPFIVLIISLVGIFKYKRWGFYRYLHSGGG